MTPDGRYWVLWDGDCGFCRRIIDWVRRQDAEDRLRVMPYQSAPSPPMTPRLRRACARSVHVITPEGRILKGGRASTCVLGVVGWRRTASLLSLPPLLWLVEIGYRVVADNRMFFSRLLFRPG